MSRIVFNGSEARKRLGICRDLIENARTAVGVYTDTLTAAHDKTNLAWMKSIVKEVDKVKEAGDKLLTGIEGVEQSLTRYANQTEAYNTDTHGL